MHSPDQQRLIDILAASVENLSDCEDFRPGLWTFTCNAMRWDASDEEDRKLQILLDKVAPGLWGQTMEFTEFRWGSERQYARALWLTFLHHLAEEGDLTWEGLK